jgi:hypothetical protein
MVQLADVLKAIGPNAAIVFAAWIFMGFLQQRYDSAVNRFREAVGDFRSNDHKDERSQNLKEQIMIYRHRCRLMGRATLVGLVSAILLIGSLIFAGLDTIFPRTPWISVVGIGALLLGFALVITAAVIVIFEGRIVGTQVEDELRDVPDLARETGHEPGAVNQAAG